MRDTVETLLPLWSLEGTILLIILLINWRRAEKKVNLFQFTVNRIQNSIRNFILIVTGIDPGEPD